MRILVVDDDFVVRYQLKSLLSAYGKCETAENGEEAFEMIKNAFNKFTPYNFITMDIEMPGMNGQEVTKKIRELENNKKVKQEERMKVLMLTGKLDEQNVLNSLHERSEWYLQKPATPEKIKDALIKAEVI